ncbi:MAG TPA: carboxylesterase family protein [Acidimicrobiales bacterium]|nr:carboxylesterase family protein [Acidimicrobiales bacterium]
MTTSGPVAGERTASGAVFRGIPYAEAPVGDRRFRPPQRPTPWTETRQATTFGPIVPQNVIPGSFASFNSTHPMGADCLSLNVWTPDPGNAGLPVFVWVHGGAFNTGSGSDSIYDGTTFARQGVVCVTVNYRLGAAGFHHLADGEPGTGAYGILDQIAALEWVQENIAAFGGDPGNVTVGGESAGGMSVGCLLAAPAAANLFHRGILQSGAGHNGLPPEVARNVAARFVAALGLSPDDLDGQRAVSDQALLEAQAQVALEVASSGDPVTYGDAVASGMAWQPMIGADVLPVLPIEAIRKGAAAGKDVLVGHCRDEIQLFVGVAPELLPITAEILPAMYDMTFATGTRSGAEAMKTYEERLGDTPVLDLWAAMETDRQFRIPGIRLAEAQTAYATVHAYEFAWESPALGGRLKAAHGLDLPFTWDVLRDPSLADLIGDTPPQELADEMHGAWVRYITTGDPGWRPYDLDRRVTRQFGGAGGEVEDPRPEERLLWDGVR